MKEIVKHLLRAEGRGFFISAKSGEIEAYRLTEEQAIDFCSDSPKIETLKKLEVDDVYEGFVALRLDEGFWVGTIDGKLQWLNPDIYEMRPFTNHPVGGPKRVIYSDYAPGRIALEQGRLFEYISNGNSALCRRLLLVRDLDIAESLKRNRQWRDPNGKPEEVDKELKNKLVSYIKGEDVDFTDEEKYLLEYHFNLEYLRIFGED
ncbi:MAG: hypothetical protein IKR92_00655 [Alphaproteobacteria bacterium]|nr:hypothetical protein [Alphaproteobacteria bacterium]